MAYNAVVAIILFIIITLMLSLAALLLPIETRGRAMKVSSYCHKFETVVMAIPTQLSCDCISLHRTLGNKNTPLKNFHKQSHKINFVYILYNLYFCI